MLLPQSVSFSINKIATQAIGKDWPFYATLMEHWSEIVGPDYANQTAPVKIQFPQGKKTDEKWASGKRGGATLSISLPQGLVFEFSHMTDQIKSRVNGFFGYAAIGQIALKPYYASHTASTFRASETPTELNEEEKSHLKNALSCIDDEALREALLTLGTSVLIHQKKV